ncbi:MAG: alpha/beta hydrolase family protein [Acidimicrobiales bacterium]
MCASCGTPAALPPHHPSPASGVSAGPQHPTSQAPGDTTAPTTTAPGPPYPVGLRTLQYTDPTRLVPADHSPDGQPSPRILRTDIYYPAAAPARPRSKPPEPARGPFPLVVFAPGYDVDTSAYAPLLDSWAQAGYVVAAVTFPLTNPSTPGGPDESDIVNQPGDLRFVIDRLVAASAAPSGLIHGLIDSSAIAIAGHSDGAEAAAAIAYDTCCRDPRIRAAIIMSGSELPMGTGTYFPPASPPLLAIQGTGDHVNPPERMDALYEADPGAKLFLTLTGADHLGPYTGGGAAARLVDAVTVDFLDAELRHDPAALGQLAAQAGSSPLARLQASQPEA